MEYCEQYGHRLCSVDEIEAGRTCSGSKMPSGKVVCDQLDSKVVWTFTPCKVTTAPAPPLPTSAPIPALIHRLSSQELRMYMDNLRERQQSMERHLNDLHKIADGYKTMLKLPFKVDKRKRTISLDGWNLNVRSSTRSEGEGNVNVGLGNDAHLADNSFVAGELNIVEGKSVTVLGGLENFAQEHFTSILGGKSNNAQMGYSAIAGGVNNTVKQHGASISGGRNNLVTGDSGVIDAGVDNIVSGMYATVDGGYFNTAIGESSTISGGARDVAYGQGAVIAQEG